MYTSCSLLLSGISILALSGIAETRRIVCNIPTEFTVDLTDNERAYFFGSDLRIDLDENALVVNSYRGTSTFHIRTENNVVVQYRGYMTMKDTGTVSAMESEKIIQTYKDRISGVAELGPHKSTGLKINHCRLVLLPVEMDPYKVHHRIANEIHRLAESCLELKICSRVDDISVQNKFQAPKRVSMGIDDIAADAWRYFNPHGCDERLYSESVQLAINKVVDVALSEVIAKVVQTKDGSIEIPDIDARFAVSLGFVTTNAHLKAVEGTFRDLTTFRRITDATLSHDGMKFMASCEFGLTIADLKFNHYKLKYQPVTINGKLSGSIDGAALKARIAVDYNLKPCVVSLEYLNVTEFGRMTVNLTGLGALNDVSSKIINWITKTWRDSVIQSLETQMRATIESQLSAIDCEKFRP